MDQIEILPLVSRWLHIIAAVILAGGIFYQRLAVVPALASTASGEAYREAIRVTWSRMVMISILFLLVSGLYNSAIKAMGFHLDVFYLTLLSVKILLSLAIFFLVSVLSGRSATARKFRDAEVKWLNVSCAMILLVVCIAGVLKMSPQEVKQPDGNETTSMAIRGDSTSLMY